MSAKKWIESTNTIGLKASADCCGGTFAHKDIVFEFEAWLSPEFKFNLLKGFHRLIYANEADVLKLYYLGKLRKLGEMKNLILEIIVS